MSDGIRITGPHPTRLSIAIIDKLVVHETGRFRIALVTDPGLFEHGRKFRSMSNIPGQAIALLNHLADLSSNGSYTDRLGYLEVIEDSESYIDIFTAGQ